MTTVIESQCECKIPFIDKENYVFTSREVHVRGNMKSLKNTIEPVYGCRGGATNQGHGCPYGCYAKFISKRIGVNFDIPVVQIVNEEILVPEIAKIKEDWGRLGTMGDPSEDWDVAIHICRLLHEAGKIPVLFTRVWKLPTKDQLQQLADYGTHLHISITPFDGSGLRADGVLIGRSQQFLGWCDFIERNYTGKLLWRVITFHYDDNMPEAEALWKVQDELMQKEHVIEQPARIIKGKKCRNPVWKYVPEWAYFKAPRTSDHKFHKSNHNWTAGILYDRIACWSGCKECSHACDTREGAGQY